jgi:hypothetical protein
VVTRLAEATADGDDRQHDGLRRAAGGHHRRLRPYPGSIDPLLKQSAWRERCGEIGTISATPAVVNAVVDALVRAGRAEAASRLQMPLTPAKVWQALVDVRPAQASRPRRAVASRG